MNINASIKKQYLDMILCGAKTTEYREMTAYWTNKLVDTGKYDGKSAEEIADLLQCGEQPLYPKPIQRITFYCDRRPCATYEVQGISAYRGHSLFAIRLGNRID